MKKIVKNKTKERGFVLLYSILVSGIILSVGLSLGNILYKQVLLSSVAKSSIFAYYAADSGRECVGFWNERRAFNPENAGQNIICGESGLSGVSSSGSNYFIVLPGQFGEETTSCSVVTIQTVDPDNDVFQAISKGYNVSCDGVNDLANNPRAVERAVDIRI